MIFGVTLVLRLDEILPLTDLEKQFKKLGNFLLELKDVLVSFTTFLHIDLNYKEEMNINFTVNLNFLSPIATTCMFFENVR